MNLEVNDPLAVTHKESTTNHKVTDQLSDKSPSVSSNSANQVTVLKSFKQFPACKVWREKEATEDGASKPKKKLMPMYFTLETKHVAGIAELHNLLIELIPESNKHIIRGEYIGDERAAVVDEKHKPGYVRRIDDVLEDAPRSWMLVEVDKFKPTQLDLEAPEAAIEEFIEQLPKEFHGVSYSWSQSSSAGHPDHIGILKAHIWFWLSTPRTSEELMEWGLRLPRKKDIPLVDVSVFKRAQMHYTAAPIWESGPKIPALKRYGFAAKDRDIVDLRAPLKLVPIKQKSTLQFEASGDEVLQALVDGGWVLEDRRNKGMVDIRCPFEYDHSDDTCDSATTYLLPGFNPKYPLGNFSCLHTNCNGIKSRSDYLEEIGLGKEDTAAGDDANGPRFFKHFGHVVKRVRGDWYAWCPGRLIWLKGAESDELMKRYAAGIKKHIEAEAREWLLKAKAADTEESQKMCTEKAKTLFKWAVTSTMVPRVRATMDMAAALFTKRDLSVVFDGDKSLFNFTNGTYDRRTRKLRSKRKSDLLTKALPHKYVPYDKASNKTRKMMEQILSEAYLPQKPKTDFYQRLIGYTFTGEPVHHIMVFHYGPSARNGKSAPLKIFSKVMGEDYASTVPDTFLTKAAQNQHPCGGETFRGKRLMVQNECGKGITFDAAVINRITSDTMTSRGHGKMFTTFEPEHVLHMTCNNLPTFRIDEPGLWDRLVVLKYLEKYGSKEAVAAGEATIEVNPWLVDEMTKDPSDVIAFILEGIAMYDRDSLDIPEEFRKVKESYRNESDDVGPFLHDIYAVDESVRVRGAELYAEFNKWCERKCSKQSGLNTDVFIQQVRKNVIGFTRKQERDLEHTDPRQKFWYWSWNGLKPRKDDF